MFFKLFECLAWPQIEFIFHMTKEGFRRGIVETVSSSWHGLNASHIFDPLSKTWMSIMESLIRMNIGSLELFSEFFIILGSFFELLQCSLHSFESEMWWKPPSKSLSCDHILHHWEVCPSFIQSEVSNICPEFLVRHTHLKFTIHEIWCCIMLLCGFLYLFVWILSSDTRKEIILLHETKHLLMIHRKS